MPKSIQSIKRFDGGLNTYSDPKDVSEEQSPEVKNFDVRRLGRLRLLGTFKTDLATIKPFADNNDYVNPDSESATAADVYVANGEPLFTYSTDLDVSGNTTATDWIAFVDRATKQLWLYPSADADQWHKFDGVNDAGIEGIDSIIGTATLTGTGVLVAYYVADGKLRVCNANFGEATLATTGASGSPNSSLWVGHIDKNFLGLGNDATGWYTLPASLKTPGADTFDKTGNLNITTSGATTIGTAVDAVGKIKMHVDIQRDKGDGTIQLIGRALYVTYTYDGSQETLPYKIATIGESDLPAAPTTVTLGYETSIMRDVDFGSATIYLRDNVMTQEDTTQKNWEDDDGIVTIEDKTGQVQSLAYTGYSVPEKKTISTITNGNNKVTVVTTGAHGLQIGDYVEITETQNDSFNTISKTGVTGEYAHIFNGLPAVPSSHGAHYAKIAGGDFSSTQFTITTDNVNTDQISNTGKVRLAGHALTGVTGWVDSGFCSINYTIDTIVITDGGSGYSSPPTVNFHDGTQGSGDGSPDTAAVATCNTTGGVVTSIDVSNFGDNYQSVPEISFSGGGGSGAKATATITGKLSTESHCTNKSGTWTASDLDSTLSNPGPFPMTYDPPGELEEQDENLGFRVHLQAKPADTKHMFRYEDGGPRITHVNVYTNKYEDDTGGAAPQQEDFAHVCTFDLSKGFKGADGSYTAWSTDATHGSQKTIASGYIGSMFTDTYQTRTGVFPDTEDISCRWKTATTINRRIYAGNVMIGTEKHPDRVVKSMPNAFDVFPDYDFLDVVVDDGDEVIHLDTFGGKLLQFKKKTLYVIDVTNEPEYLAGTFRYRGVPHPSCVTRADEGVIFANEHGVFTFNGESVVPILKNKIDDDWQDFYDDTNFPILAFDPTNQSVIINKSDSDDMLFYDMISKSWTKGDGALRNPALKKTQMIVYKGKIYQGFKEEGGNDDNKVFFREWKDSFPTGMSNTNAVEWRSREFDLGDPSVDSKIYNLKITYKTSNNNASNITLALKCNKGDGVVSESLTGGALGGTNGKWKTVEVKPSTSNLVTKTVQVVLSSDGSNEANEAFEVNDISLIYRNKSIK